MRVPGWARWALAVALVLGVAAAGVAANLAVLDSGTDGTRLGTLSAGSLALSSGEAPPQARQEPGADADDRGEQRGDIADGADRADREDRDDDD